MVQLRSRYLKQSGLQKAIKLKLPAAATIFYVLLNSSKGLLKIPLI